MANCRIEQRSQCVTQKWKCNTVTSRLRGDHVIWYMIWSFHGEKTSSDHIIWPHIRIQWRNIFTFEVYGKFTLKHRTRSVISVSSSVPSVCGKTQSINISWYIWPLIYVSAKGQRSKHSLSGHSYNMSHRYEFFAFCSTTNFKLQLKYWNSVNVLR
jgi:hypothetical protein